MVNLLFITNSTKIDAIKNDLQPLLKVKIDIVADFDFGLKDVFEKRPATVFIQDQIAGVTGESVARHIQMLLGTGTPSFIFMHEGSSKAKPIKGLFEYLIDLSQSDEKIVADIQATLKTLLGTQWEKIYIPPKIDKAAIRDVVAVPEGNRAVADQPVDDFLTDLDGFGSPPSGNISPTTNLSEPLPLADEPFHVVSTPHDQLAEMMSESSRDPVSTNSAIVRADEDSVKKVSTSAPETGFIQDGQQQPLPNRPVAVASAESPAKQTQPAPKVSIKDAPVTLPLPGDVAVAAQGSVPVNPMLQQSSPANFIIGGEKNVEDVAPEELLRVFEGNYYQYSGGWKRNVILVFVVAICAAGGIWYLLKQRPHLFRGTSSPTAQPVVIVPAARPLAPATTIQKTVAPPAKAAEAPTLPTFIPKTGLDSSFASQKPGWERYVDTSLEFRLYRPAGKIKALQVLGVKNHEISEPKLKSILIELLGDGEYHVKSSEQKLGYNISRATVGQKADLMIYRKKATVRAFVVSIN